MRNIDEIFAFNLRTLREGCNLTQGQLAERIGVAVTTVQGWENKRRWPEYDHILSLSRVLQVQASRLFYDPDLIIRPTVAQSLDVIVEALGPYLPGKKKGLSAGIPSGMRREIA